MAPRPPAGPGCSVSTDDVRDLAGEIEWAKASLISPEDYAAAVAEAGRDIPLDAGEGGRRLRRVRDGSRPGATAWRCSTSTTCCCTPPPRSRTTRRWPQEFRDRYRCFVVDEYQDVTPLQQRVLDAWLGERDDLTVVGDANQTIYSFTGATPRYLLDFSRRFPDAAVVRLERDYRSTPQVVSLANRVIAAARGRVAGSKLHLVGQRDPGPAPTFAEYPDEVAEAGAVAKKITKLIEVGHAAVGDRGAVPDQRPVGGVRGGADRGRRRRSRCAAAKGSSAARRSGRRCSRCSARPSAAPTRRPPTAAVGARSCSSRWA